ncbi:MAG: hypothetical protein AB7I79_14385 [Rhizobiaceae bacterium]
MKAGIGTAIAAVGFLAGVCQSAAATIDIRDCPLDTTVFVDPWAGASFTVERVGTLYNWLCPDGFEPPDAMCSGPYGDLVLEGSYRESNDGEPKAMTAIWSVIKGVPCCGWNVEDGRSAVTGNADFRWLAPADVPTLREMPFLSIEALSYQGSDFGNPVNAASCRTR